MVLNWLDLKKKEYRERSGACCSVKISLLLGRGMTNGELKEYLNTFPDDAPISLILANPRERKLYEVNNTFGVTDVPNPTFCIEVGKATDMDAELVEACEEDEKNAHQLAGQMNITDFPEVMP